MGKKGEWLWEKEERGKNYGGKKNVGKIKVEKRETIMVWKRKSNILQRNKKEERLYGWKRKRERMLVKGEENFTGKKGRGQRNGGKKK